MSTEDCQKRRPSIDDKQPTRIQTFSQSIQGGNPCGGLISRIEALNKKPLKNIPEKKRPLDTDGLTSTTSESKAQNAVPDEPVDTKPIKLEDLVGGMATPAPLGPGYYHVEMPATSLEAAADLMHKRLLSLTGHPDGKAVERLAHVCKSERIAPDEIIFLDLETTGLGSTPVFLVGTMECASDEFIFKQYFARNYSEEASIVSAFSERMRNVRLVITFNGKCFDVPFLANRAAANGAHLPVPEYHLDLLHESRRRYRRDLPNCRLQTLERMICGRDREDDIPSSQIPKAYKDFVRTGDASEVARILQHNLYDLLTLADLMHRMWYR